MKTLVLIENCKVIPSTSGETARSILIHGGRIERISDSPTQSVEGELLRLDARECTVLPGLIDTHCHPFQQGASRRVLDLRDSASITSLRLRLQSRVERSGAGQWIIGRGWDQEMLAERRFPTRDDIDDLTPNNPALLTRVCEHVAVLNTRALQLVGLEESSATDSGLVGRDARGRLTGIVREAALASVWTRVPKPSVETTEEELLTAEYEATKNGITTIHCLLSDNFELELQALNRLHDRGALSLRYRVYVPAGSLESLEKGGLESFPSTETLSLKGVKLFADGSLGARTAALSKPYSDDQDQKGILTYDDDEFESILLKIGSLRIQAAVHAIGDAAVTQTLGAFAKTQGNIADRRWRIEHASLTSGEIRRRMKEQRTCITVQPYFLISDGWAANRLGEERLKGLYAYKSFIADRIRVSAGSDAPVSPLSPLLGIWSAMVRSGYGEQEKLTLEEGLALYTSNAAYLSFDEGNFGRIEEGLAADLTILDSDIEGLHPAMIRRVNIARTLVNGNLVYSSEGLANS